MGPEEEQRREGGRRGGRPGGAEGSVVSERNFDSGTPHTRMHDGIWFEILIRFGNGGWSPEASRRCRGASHELGVDSPR